MPRTGGSLTVALPTEPATLNPLVALDNASNRVLALLHSSLVRINRSTLGTEPFLAKSWSVSPDGLRYTLELRKDLRFSDGEPFDADDVIFSFDAILDERNLSPQRPLLIVGGEPIRVGKLDDHTVTVDLAAPYAAAERLFDSIAMLPGHRLEPLARAGRLREALTLRDDPASIVGTGPFRVRRYVAGERLELERNPHYWRRDEHDVRLPYLDEVVFLFVPSADAQVLRFRAGQTDLISTPSVGDFDDLSGSDDLLMLDLGPDLRTTLMFFNLNPLPAQAEELRRAQRWFQHAGFRRAVSAAIDREGIARLIYRNRATPVEGTLTQAHGPWANANIRPAGRSLDVARRELADLGFTWDDAGGLLDDRGVPVVFSILVSSSNAARQQMATMIQQDLAEVGITVQVTPLEFRAISDRLFSTKRYEACLLTLGGGDVDPNSSINLWMSSGSSHVWHPSQEQPATDWEARIDELMRRQLSTLDPVERKRLFDEVQEIAARELPLIPLVSPNVLVGHRVGLGNVEPAILDPYLLWNVDRIFWRTPR